MQEVENYLVEYEAQTMHEEGRASEFLDEVLTPQLKQQLDEEDLEYLADWLSENWSDWAEDNWSDAEIHDKAYAEVEKLREAWLAQWDKAAQQYAASLEDFSEDEQEEVYELLTDEEDGAFWAYMEEAGHGVGAYDCEHGNWPELCELGVEGAADILKLMPSGFTLNEQLFDSVSGAEEALILLAVEEYLEGGLE